MSDKSGLEKAGTWAFRAYCAFFLLAPLAVLFDPELADSEFLYRRLIIIWEWAGSISDPVFRVICYVLVIVTNFLVVLGWFGGLIAWAALILGIIAPYFLLKGLLWLASFSLGAAIVVAVVLTATLVAILRAYWEPIIEWIARVVLTFMALFGVPVGGSFRELHPVTRLGATGICCGMILLAVGVWRHAPIWLDFLVERLPIQREYTMTVPVGRWSETLYIPESKMKGKLKRLAVDSRVVAQDNHGRCFLARPGEIIDLTKVSPWPNTLRLISLTGKPVKVAFTSLGAIPITSVSEPTRPNTRIPACVESKFGFNLESNDQVDDTPTFISGETPEATEQARKANVKKAYVEVECFIDERGRVRDARVTRSPGYGLGERTMITISKWRFKPAMKGGRPVNVSMIAWINFLLL